jgi:hypothetical protein
MTSTNSYMAAAAGLSVPTTSAGIHWPCSEGHPTRPLDHLNGAGLLWRISGGRISSLETDWATIEINAAQRIIHRRPSLSNFVLPWSDGQLGRYCSPA